MRADCERQLGRHHGWRPREALILTSGSPWPRSCFQSCHWHLRGGQPSQSADKRSVTGALRPSGEEADILKLRGCEGMWSVAPISPSPAHTRWAHVAVWAGGLGEVAGQLCLRPSFDDRNQSGEWWWGCKRQCLLMLAELRGCRLGASRL